jgi:hypothetical protein
MAIYDKIQQRATSCGYKSKAVVIPVLLTCCSVFGVVIPVLLTCCSVFGVLVYLLSARLLA